VPGNLGIGAHGLAFKDHASAMDGFALRAADTAGAGPNEPVTLACLSASGLHRRAS
jgi:molybdopterin biosynthesis enzyme